MQPSATIQQRFHAFLAANPDEAILRWIFRSVVTVTIVVLAADLAGMNGWIDTSGSQRPKLRHDTPSLDLPDIVPSILTPLAARWRQTPDAAAASQMARWPSR